MSQGHDGKPVVLHAGDSARSTPLERVPCADRSVCEGWLQQVLFDHPSLIPAGELEPGFAPMRALAREVQTPGAGPADLLCISPSGLLTVVETKLLRNPEARREVVGQVIDYAAAISGWSYDDLVAGVRATKGVSGTPDPVMAAVADAVESPVEFRDRVEANLRRGRFLLVIVGDQVHRGVLRMAEFMRPNLGFTLALVELAVYRWTDGDLLIVPRVVERTREVTRAIIEIRAPLKPADVTVTVPAAENRSDRVARARWRITEEDFFERLSKSSPAAAGFVRNVLPSLEERGLTLEWTDAGVIYKLETDGPATFSLGAFSAAGEFRIGVTVLGACRSAGVPAEVLDSYVAGLLTLMPRAVRKPRGTGGIRLSRTDGGGEPLIEWMSGKETEFLAVVDRFVADVGRSLESGPV